jgi:hypothetical protein
MRASRDAFTSVATMRFWSLGPRSSSCESDSGACSDSQVWIEPNLSSATLTSAACASSVVQPPA